ncbi:MAG: hypothetical protein M0T84_11775 [Betaproteobacteria bacterium]|nr:hypothetical protein [Betaproteobacteria bacterium]
MQEACDALFLAAGDVALTLEQLSEASGLAAEQIAVLVDYGVLRAQGDEPARWTFSASAVVMAKRGGRLARHFDLNPEGMALALIQMERIAELERRLRWLECALPSESQ